MEENKWETYSEEMEDDDLAMEVEEMEDEDMTRNSTTGSQLGSRQSYLEEFSSKASGAFKGGSVAPMQKQPIDYRSSVSSPMHSFSDMSDEKNETDDLLTQMLSKMAHIKFFRDFEDDFDEDDLT